MTKMKGAAKKSILLFLSLVLAASLSPASAFADGTPDGATDSSEPLEAEELMETPESEMVLAADEQDTVSLSDIGQLGITAPQITVGNGGTMTVQWTALTDGQASGYEVRYAVVGAGFLPSIILEGVGNSTIEISGLKVGQKYSVAVRAFLRTGDAASHSQWSETSTSGFIPGWAQKGGKKHYFTSDKMAKGWQKINGKTYYFNAKGQMQVNKMISKNKFVNKNGVLVHKKDISKLGKKGLSKLEKKLRAMTKNRRGSYSIYVKNLDTNEYMIINNKKTYPASVIKLLTMAATYEYIDKRAVKKTSDVKRELKAMITVSSNDSYNYLLKKIGKGSLLAGAKKANQFCKKQGYTQTNFAHSLTPSSHGYQGTGGKQYTSVRDVGRCLEDIYRGALVSEKASKEMLGYLRGQTYLPMIPAGLPKGVKQASKSGNVSQYWHDSAIVYGKKSTYVVVVFTTGASIGDIRAISQTVYRRLN